MPSKADTQAEVLFENERGEQFLNNGLVVKDGKIAGRWDPPLEA